MWNQESLLLCIGDFCASLSLCVLFASRFGLICLHGSDYLHCAIQFLLGVRTMLNDNLDF